MSEHHDSYESHIDSQEQVIPGVTPGALLDAMEDPEQFAAIARADLYVQMAMMRRAAASPEMPFNQRSEYSKFLAKMGKVDQPDNSGNEFSNLPGIVIDLGQGQSVSIGAQKKLPAAPSAQQDEWDERDVGPKKQSTAVLP